MSQTSCIKISSCVIFFMIISCAMCYVSLAYFKKMRGLSHNYSSKTLTVLELYVQCDLEDWSTSMKTPSLESLIQASGTGESQELRLSGLAVFSNLTNACQPPVDVSKSNIQINKIALISLANVTACRLKGLAVNAQNAGYSVMIYFADSRLDGSGNQTEDILPLIPVLHATRQCVSYLNKGFVKTVEHNISNSDLSYADRSNVEIRVQNTDDLKKMQTYLERLYYWFLLGPIITLEWLRRTRRLCCNQSGGQQRDEERAVGGEETGGETGLHLEVEQTQGNFDQETEHEQTEGEEQPLISVINDPRTSLTSTGHTRYVFYISVCMVCAYVESDIVAVFYFMLNSEGSLTNLKLTALRTVAIGLTLTLSLSSSMHIIRKLNKPQESLFEGLSEK
ncbi:hypothetical protein ACROYT_G010048 [Oculina patagonica]